MTINRPSVVYRYGYAHGKSSGNEFETSSVFMTLLISNAFRLFCFFLVSRLWFLPVPIPIFKCSISHRIITDVIKQLSSILGIEAIKYNYHLLRQTRSLHVFLVSLKIKSCNSVCMLVERKQLNLKLSSSILLWQMKCRCPRKCNLSALTHWPYLTHNNTCIK